MSRWTRYNMMSINGHVGRLSIPPAPGVYVIYFDGTPVYVGQSANVKARLGSYKFRYGYARNIHTPWMELADSVAVTVKVKCSRRMGDWAMWEIRLISRLQPEFNTHHLRRRAA